MLEKSMSNMNIGIIVSEFNEDITSALLSGTVERLYELEFTENNLRVVKVPGAIEIPLVAKFMAMSKRYSAIICLGAVIRGETSHYDYVCMQVSQGCQKVMLEYDMPVIFGVLTTENEEQALDRVGGKFGHKGVEAADAAWKMINLIGELR